MSQHHRFNKALERILQTFLHDFQRRRTVAFACDPLLVQALHEAMDLSVTQRHLDGQQFVVLGSVDGHHLIRLESVSLTVKIFNHIKGLPDAF